MLVSSSDYAAGKKRVGVAGGGWGRKYVYNV